ncbi:cellulose binding domain-containing protein [Micromonospora sp. Llam7]|nr:cellulose binding domain-containing protein [Micromonospora tarapacensis]
MRRAPRQFPPSGSAAVASSSPWILVSVGVVIMAVLLIVAIGAYRGPGPDYQPGPPAAAVPLPERASSAAREAPAPLSPAVPRLSPRRTDPPSPTPTASPTPEPPAASSPSAAPSGTPDVPSPPPIAPPAPLEARYRVRDTFPGGFIAEVLIHNTSHRDVGWVARVEYPGGRVVTAWLEGVPQGTFNGTGGTLTYRSGPDLPAGSAVALRFHIEFAHPRPASCSVSGRSCRGR